MPLYPIGNTGVPADSKVLFAWKPYTGAVNYTFHIWLVKQSGTVALTPATPNTASTTIFRKTSYTWTNHGFLAGTYQYALMPLDANGNTLAGWSRPAQIQIVSS